MKNNKLMVYKENIFTKISKFFKNIFFRKKEDDISVIKENNSSKENFIESIQIREDEEERRLKNLQLQYDNGEIDEEDISYEDMERLIEMYEKETDELNADTERRKKHIAQMLNELKCS